MKRGISEREKDGPVWEKQVIIRSKLPRNHFLDPTTSRFSAMRVC
jgi:hypothetical protein